MKIKATRSKFAQHTYTLSANYDSLDWRGHIHVNPRKSPRYTAWYVTMQKADCLDTNDWQTAKRFALTDR